MSNENFFIDMNLSIIENLFSSFRIQQDQLNLSDELKNEIHEIKKDVDIIKKDVDSFKEELANIKSMIFDLNNAILSNTTEIHRLSQVISSN